MDDVLQRIVKPVTEMERPGDIGWRDHDGERSSVWVNLGVVRLCIVPNLADSWRRCGMIEAIRNYVHQSVCRISRGFFFVKFVFDGINERLPACLDDVFTDADRAPCLVVVAAFDIHANRSGGATARINNANFVVNQTHVFEARKGIL